MAGVSVLGLVGPATAATGPETFRLVFVGTFTFGASNTGTVSAVGPITAVGQAVNSGFVPDQFGNFTGSNQLRFPAGNLNVNFGGHLDSFSFDPRTCITQITGHGTWTVASGTGAYTGTTGGGTFVNNVTLVGTRTAQGCGEPTREISQITLTGAISTP
jgi:hypothetical protein